MKNVKTRITLILVLSICCALPVMSQSQKTAKKPAKSKKIRPAGYTLPKITYKPATSPVYRQAGTMKVRTMPKLQRAYLAKDRSQLKALAVHRQPETGQVILLKTAGKAYDPAAMLTDRQVEDASIAYLESAAAVLGLENVKGSFDLSVHHRDKLGHTHVKLQQYYRGIPVYASEIMVHFRTNGEQVVNGRYEASPKGLNVSPTITARASEDLAKIHLGQRSRFIEKQPRIKGSLNLRETETELVILGQLYTKGKPELVWHHTLYPNFLERWEYFVNAHTGEITLFYDHTCSIDPDVATATDLNGDDRTINVYEEAGTYYMLDISRGMFNANQSDLPDDPVGAIWTIDAQNTDLDNIFQVSSPNNTWTDASAVSAHFNAGLTFEYFLNTHGRNSIDGNGGTIISVVNVTSNGNPMDNAYWNGQVMAYGNGDQAFTPLAGALDVAAHEMTHGVISKTANLEYMFQSGAINESIADIFGAMVDRDDWQLGEDICLQSVFPSGALRDLEDPHNGGTPDDFFYQPANMSEFQDLSSFQDNGGVHINSGIPNHAFFRYATAIGKDDAEDVYYKALTDYLTRSSQFIDLRIAVIQAATDLFGASSTQVTEARNAFDDVEIFDANGGNYEVDLSEHEGQDWILGYDINPANSHTFFISDITGSPTSFEALTTTVSKRKPSIPDAGGFALFVDTDNNIKIFDTDKDSTKEGYITDDEFWDNVAVSKDGSKLAGISIYVDTTIYVYDFGKEEWKEFTLYNPTFDSTITTGGPRYADALEWDYSGEFLIYDAYNVIENPGGEDITYWDVNFIKVWDNTADDFADGEVTKLFASLPEDVSIGNPIFSKNSPYIVAYDYWDDFSGDIFVQAANIENGEVGTIFSNDLLGNPSYSKNDDQMVFTTIMSSDTVIGIIDLKDNKIEPDGSTAQLIILAKWPVWYSKGHRVSVEELENLSGDPLIQVLPNPTSGQLTIEFQLEASRDVNITLYDIHGREMVHLARPAMNAGHHRESLSLDHLPAGTYILTVDKEHVSRACRLIKF